MLYALSQRHSGAMYLRKMMALVLLVKNKSLLRRVALTYLGVPAPDISNTSVLGSSLSGMMRASPKSKSFTVEWNDELWRMTSYGMVSS